MGTRPAEKVAPCPCGDQGHHEVATRRTLNGVNIIMSRTSEGGYLISSRFQVCHRKALNPSVAWAVMTQVEVAEDMSEVVVLIKTARRLYLAGKLTPGALAKAVWG